MKKRYIFYAVWSAYCLINISLNHSNYSIGDFMVVIGMLIIPIAVSEFIFRKKSKKSSDSEKPNLSNEMSEEVEDVKHQEYVKVGSVVYHADGSSITEEEIPYLQEMNDEEIKKAQDSSPNPKYHRTPEEDELSFQFSSENGDKLQKYVNRFEELYGEANKTNDLSQRIIMLNQAIDAFNLAKDYCYSSGDGGRIFFQDMWENMDNSRDDCYSYLDNIKSDLNEALYERDVLIPSVTEVLETHDNILQKDIYKELPDFKKSAIQGLLRQMEEDGKLLRKKKSSTYVLHLL